jgi:hypothetical protein
MLPGVGPSTELEACIKEFTADGAIEISREWRVCRPLRGTLLGRSACRGEASPPSVVGESQSNAPRSCHHRSFRFGSQDTWLVPRREAQAPLDASRSALESSRGPLPTCGHHPSHRAGTGSLRFRGLAFARWDDGPSSWGVPSSADTLGRFSLGNWKAHESAWRKAAGATAGFTFLSGQFFSSPSRRSRLCRFSPYSLAWDNVLFWIPPAQ